MRNQRNTLLAGIAALALVTGTGLASAQDNAAQGHNTTPGANQHNTSQGTGKMSAPSQGMMNKNSNERGVQNYHGAQATTPNGHQANRDNKTNKEKMSEGQQSNTGKMGETQAAPAKNAESQSGASKMDAGKMGENSPDKATRGENRAGQNETQMDNGRAAENGNAAGGSVKLSSEQQTKIRETIVDARGAPKAGNVNFDVRVGTVVPRGHVREVVVPETLVRIEPRWRGFRYFVFNDDVVIVNPHDGRIVAVLPV